MSIFEGAFREQMGNAVDNWILSCTQSTDQGIAFFPKRRTIFTYWARKDQKEGGIKGHRYDYTAQDGPDSAC